MYTAHGFDVWYPLVNALYIMASLEKKKDTIQPSGLICVLEKSSSVQKGLTTSDRVKKMLWLAK